MRNLIIILVVAFSCSQEVNAQTVKCGAMIGSFATTNFKSNEKPFDLGFNLFANTALIAKRTFHNLFLNLGGNSLGLNQGVFLKNDFDVYFLNSKSLSRNSYYSAIGVEKMLKLGDQVCFLFCEVGTDYHGHTSATVGVLMTFQTKIWRKK